MNTTLPLASESEHEEQPVHLEVVPASLPPLASRHGETLVLENGPSLPTEVCIKTGRPAAKQMSVSVRNPKNPITWFGPQPKIEVGMSKAAVENHQVALALTWSLLGIGLVVLVVGAATLSFVTSFIGLLVAGVSGAFRAASPVRAVGATDDYMILEGVSSRYLAQFPEYADTHPE